MSELNRVGQQPGRHRRLKVAAIAAVAACLGVAAAQAQTATVNLNTRQQTFEGWGTSLAWWANVVGGYPTSYRNTYMTAFFDPVNGLGLNIVRYNIGGGENPAYLPPNTTYLQYRARVPGFESSLGNYNWSADANQRSILQQSISMGVNIEEAFSNSPPYWMTNSGSVTGAHGGGAENLQTSQYGNFADYLTTVVKHYHDSFGITFRTLDGLNEPASGYWNFGNGQEGCNFAPAEQDVLIKDIGASLASKGMNYTSVSASDETSIDTAVSTFNSLDSTAKNYIAQINTHTYEGSERTQLQQLAASNHKRLWMSEHGDGDGTGLSMAESILYDMHQMQPNGWVYWQTVDNAAGWGFGNNPLDGSANYALTLNEKYYVMGNFSKYIRPGYQFVGMSDNSSVAAYDGKSTVAIVTVNDSNSTENYTYQLQNFPGGTWTVVPHRTSANENLVQQSSFAASGSFTYSLPAYSVTTFVLTSNSGGGGPVVSGTRYEIVNKNSGALLDDPASSNTAGTQMDQWSSNGGSNQKWLATAAGNNFIFTNVASGLVLDVSGASHAAGAAVDQWTANQGTNQMWSIVPVGDGSYKVVSQVSGLLLDVISASSANGALIDQYTDNGGGNQHWTFQATN
ncbi:MAG TPA: RICIN domain-containing protein [Acidisarcina sp.]